MDTDKKETALEEQLDLIIKPYVIFNKDELKNMVTTNVEEINSDITFI